MFSSVAYIYFSSQDFLGKGIVDSFCLQQYYLCKSVVLFAQFLGQKVHLNHPTNEIDARQDQLCAAVFAEKFTKKWWRYQMETFSALLVICAGNSPVTSEFPAQRPVTRSFDVFFDLRPNKRLSK